MINNLNIEESELNFDVDQVHQASHFSSDHYCPEIFQETGLLNFELELNNPFIFCDEFNPITNLEETNHLDRSNTGNLGSHSSSDSQLGNKSFCLDKKTTQESLLKKDLSTDLQVKDHEEIKTPPEQSKDAPKDASKKRWGRSQDKMLFKHIRKMEQHKQICMGEVFKLQTYNDCLHDESLQELSKSVGWKASAKKLLARIKSLWDTEFSCREVKQLKQILKRNYEYKGINLNEVIYHFPGKNMLTLEKMVDILVQKYKKKSLSIFKKL
ncbi:unnamed protein product [Moneuplotes crassus]|uniref:Uncharacterized protein n=1 Tax=Euplotes crassus TaxID=5936 RepID=A0AAD1Y313_EUPCR|nr:unnamed protein product [Moneuplotes crassus]